MALTILLFALGGCAGMDREECRTADWRAIGYEDGVQGQSAAYFGTRRKACAEHGITADFDAYLAGRAAGLAHFCRPQNGYQLGVQGHPPETTVLMACADRPWVPVRARRKFWIF